MKLVSNDQNTIVENNINCDHDEEEWQVKCSIQNIHLKIAFL